jgi:hypothetical protein
MGFKLFLVLVLVIVAFVSFARWVRDVGRGRRR